MIKSVITALTVLVGTSTDQEAAVVAAEVAAAADGATYVVIDDRQTSCECFRIYTVE